MLSDAEFDSEDCNDLEVSLFFYLSVPNLFYMQATKASFLFVPLNTTVLLLHMTGNITTIILFAPVMNLLSSITTTAS